MMNVWPRSTGNVLNKLVYEGELTLRAIWKAICTDFSDFGSDIVWSVGTNGTKVRVTLHIVSLKYLDIGQYVLT